MIKYKLMITWDDQEKQFEIYDLLDDALTASDIAVQTYGDEILSIEIIPYNPYKSHKLRSWRKNNDIID